MRFLTTPAVSKHQCIFIAISIIIISSFTGCAPTPTPPPQAKVTSLQLRAMQTRTYDKVKVQIVMKSVMSALQDEGYILANADSTLGFIYGAKEKYEVDENTKAVAEFNMGSGSGTYQTTLRLEASATVRKYKDGVKVRINIIEKAISNTGGNIWSQPIHRAAIYQDIFLKVDKSLFLEKQNM
jgi:hypothetical protein